MSTTNGSFEIGDILDFMKEVTALGGDILTTAEEIEDLFEKGFDQFLDGSQLVNMQVSVLAIFDEIIAQPDLIDPTALQNIISKVRVTIEEAIGGASLPSLDIDFSDALLEVQKIFPEDLPGIDLTQLKPIVDAVIDTLADSGLSIRFVRDNPALDAEVGNPSGVATSASQAPIEGRGQSSAPVKALDSAFETLLEDFFNTSSITVILEGLPDQIETAVADAGIMLILEDHLLALKDTLKNAAPLTLDLVISEFGELANALGTAALEVIKNIIAIIIAEFNNIYTEIKTLGLQDEEPYDGSLAQRFGEQVNGLLGLLQLGEVDRPGIFTLPAVFFAIPLTFVSANSDWELPDFSNIIQDTYDITNNAALYGANQIADGVASTIFSIAGANMADNHKSRLTLELIEKIWGVLSGAFSQVVSIPTDYEVGGDPADKDLTVIIWEYQWFMVAWSFFLVPWHYVKKKRLQQHPIAELLEPLSGFLLETIHLILFSIQFDRELKEDYRVSSRDERIGAASILDPIPGLFGSFFTLIGMGTEPFSNPNTPGKAIENAIDTIQETVATAGPNTAGDVLSQLITEIQADGNLRTLYTNAANRLAAAEAGSIQAVFDGLDPTLRGNGAGTLGEAINNVKTDLTIMTIGTNSTDFTAAEDQLELTQQLLAEAVIAFNPLYPPLDIAMGLWEGLQNTFATPHTSDVETLINLVDIFTTHIDEAYAALDDANDTLIDLQADTGDLAEAKIQLDPTSAAVATLGITLANARTALDAYRTELDRRLDNFNRELQNKLMEVRPLSNQTAQLDQVIAILTPQNTNANSIGRLLFDTHNSLEDIRTSLQNMLNSQASNAIELGVSGLQDLNTNFTAELGQLTQLFSQVIDNELTPLRASANTLADTLRQDGNQAFATAYRNLLNSLDLAHTEVLAAGIQGITALKEVLAQAIDTTLTAARQRLEAFDEDVEERVLGEITVADNKLAAAKDLLPQILARLDGLSPHPDATTQRNFIEFRAKMAETEGPIDTAVDKLVPIQEEGAEARAAIVHIQNAIADQNAGGFQHQLAGVDASLSAGGTVGTFLQNASQDLAFVNGAKADLEAPFTQIDAIKKAIVSLKDKISMGGVPARMIEKKVIAIVENLNKLESISSKKDKRKKREDSKFITYVPIVSTFLIKMAYGGLNFWKAGHPSPEIASIESDPPGSLTLLAELKDIGSTNYSDQTNIGWEKKQNEKWESLLADGVFQNSITLSLEDLAHDIRARVNYPPGFSSTPFSVPNLAPVDIELTPNAIIEDMDVSSPVDIGIISVIDPNGTTYTENELTLSGADVASFQIVDTIEGSMLQLKAGTNIDFDTRANPFFELLITATDPDDSSLVFIKSFQIDLTNVDEAPGAIGFTPASVLVPDSNIDNTFLLSAAGNVKDQDLGTLEAVDPEGAPIIFSVTPAETFEIVSDNVLRLKAVLAEGVSVVLTASDKLTDGLISTQTITIQIETI